MNVAFGEILNAKYYGQKISVRAIVSGKSLSPYSIPKKIKVICSHSKDKKCIGEFCPMFHNDTVKITVDDNLLHFIDVPDTRIGGVIKQIFKISCFLSYEILDVQNVERIFLSAPTGKERITTNSSYVCYYLGHGIDINTIYELEGYSTVDPSDQLATCIFTKANKLKSDVESFVMTKKFHNTLKQFRFESSDPSAIFGHLEEVYEYYARNITKIYGRFHLHLGIDLAFHSPLHFYFDNEYVHKGWIDCIIIGDTRCGKGYVAERLVNYFNVGKTVSGDNASFAGLIGGLQQFNGHWVATWGEVPMNDKGLVVIDEAGEIKHEDWTRLSRVRSEGIAEIVKIQKQTTNARTRLISLVNPPLKTIASYSYGIQSLMDVIKAPEDVARFDYAIVVSHDDVSIEDINTSRPNIDVIYSPEDEEKLIMWIWSRKKNQIEFTSDAIKCAYEMSVNLSKTYTFTIPLIQGENIRIKLAKLACCFAGRLYSSTDDGDKILVKKIHVQCAYYFFNLIYGQESCGYRQFSNLQKTIDAGANEDDIKRIASYFNTYKTGKMMLCECLLRINSITINDLVESLNFPREHATELLSKLITTNMITKKYASTYVKNPSFAKWLKKTVAGEKENK